MLVNSVVFFSILFSIGHNLSSTLRERTETDLITELDQTGGPCIAAKADFLHLKESLSHVMAQILPFLLIYGWCYVLFFLFLLSIQPAHTVLTTFDDVDGTL